MLVKAADFVWNKKQCEIRCFHQPNTLFETVYLFFFGLFLLYQGYKRFREAHINQYPFHWYTQPYILFGIGILLGIPGTFLDVALNKANSNESIIIWLLYVPSFVFVLAAAFFYFRGVLGKNTLK